MTYKPLTYNRNELYKQVWEKPVQEVARSYGISDVALAKVCRKLAVPVPYRGYWARKASGQNPKQTPLPEVPLNFKTELRRLGRTGGRSTPVTLPPDIQSKVSREKLAENAITVSPSLIDPHRLVARTARILGRRKPSNDGILRQASERCLDIEVSPAALDRALKIMDAFIKACEQRGLTVIPARRMTPSKPGQREPTEDVLPETTSLQVEGETITLRLVEKCDTTFPPAPKPPEGLSGYTLKSWIRRNRPEPTYHPSGELQLMLKTYDSQASWKDGKQQRLENCLNDAVARLFILAQRLKDNRAEQEQWNRDFEENKRRRREEERRTQEEQERAKTLLARLSNWRLAREIRTHITEITAILDKEEVTLNPDGELAKELKWALLYADKIDPVTPLLNEIAEEKETKDDKCE